MAIGSADEMQVWCDYAADLGYIPANVVSDWRQEYSNIARSLVV